MENLNEDIKGTTGKGSAASWLQLAAKVTEWHHMHLRASLFMYRNTLMHEALLGKPKQQVGKVGDVIKLPGIRDKVE